MHINIEVEFKHQVTGPRNVPAGLTEEFVIPTPEGWTGISWGFMGVHPQLEFQTGGFAVGPEGRQAFLATVRNPTVTDRPVRFMFVLLKA